MSFIPDFDVMAAFTLAVVLISLTPGPDMTLFLARALGQGKRAGQAAMLGAMSGLVVHTILVAFGVSALLAASQTAFTVLKIVGAGYLLWLGFQAIRNGSQFVMESGDKKQNTFFENWLAGLTINLLNPKIVVFFITFLPQFVDVNDANATYKFLFLGGYFIVVGLAICLMIITIAGRFVDTLKNNPRIARILNYSFASVFAAFAIKILATEKL